MPTSYEHRSENIVHCYASGNYSFKETYNNYKTALEDPKSDCGVNVLMDVRKSEEIRTSREMNLIADLFSKSSNFRGRCAILVSRESTVRFGLARMLSIFAEMQNMSFMAFYDEDEALAWLAQKTIPQKDQQQKLH
ncbi:MAG: hypothetical protein AB7T22_09100 [Calditrichaceae bacterium]